MTDHLCHATGCTVRCKPEYLMCPAHWRQVPLRFKHLVWKQYRPGQCDDKTPSPQWRAAADVAIACVAFRERRISEATLARIKQKASEVLKGED